MSNIAPLRNKDANVPYLYIKAKQKDVNKVRPFASYYFHPLKLVFSYASMALLLTLQLIPDHHFNLFRTFDTLPLLNEIIYTAQNHFDSLNTDDENSFPPIFDLATYAGDIKNLFTELEHEEITKAVIWTLKTVQSLKNCRGRKFVTLNLKNKGDSRIGPSYDGDFTITISFEKIFDICKFDMENAYFYIHTYILKQIHGIPQGSPLSPALAQCLLIYYEAQFLSSIYDNTYFFGLRYFDDLRLLAFSYSHSQLQRASHTISKFISALPDSLVLEPECCDKGFYFLECLIAFDPPKFMIIYLSKNYEFYKTHHKLKFHALQSYYSYHADRDLIALNNLKSKFTAMIFYCNSNQAIFTSVLSWFQDFYVAKYPLPIIKQAFRHFYRKTFSPVWLCLCHEIDVDYSPRADIFKCYITAYEEFFHSPFPIHDRSKW